MTTRVAMTISLPLAMRAFVRECLETRRYASTSTSTSTSTSEVMRAALPLLEQREAGPMAKATGPLEIISPQTS